MPQRLDDARGRHEACPASRSSTKETVQHSEQKTQRVRNTSARVVHVGCKRVQGMRAQSEISPYVFVVISARRAQRAAENERTKQQGVQDDHQCSRTPRTRLRTSAIAQIE